MIYHNILAMNAERMLGITDRNTTKSTQKLSSGYKINKAADNAAGLAISEEMRSQIRGLMRGAQNIQEGIDYCQTADGALGEINDMLQRMNELSIQAANGTNSTADRSYIDEEIKELKKEMDRICETTKFNEEYIFKCRDDEKKTYQLKFSGYLNDLCIYNETYDDSTGDVTYGGVAYKGKRYAWSSISAAMYDDASKTFNAGTYSFKADDGTYLTLVCEQGATIPKVSREFVTSAGDSGIYINNELIPWKDVKTKNGQAFDKDHILDEEYFFDYKGTQVSFKPDLLDDFEEIKAGLSNLKLETVYQVPNEETALFGNFGDSYSAFLSNAQVKNYIDGLQDFCDDIIMRADDSGIWLERKDGSTLDNSKKEWKEIGITNWGDQSKDIWETKEYEYEYESTDGLKLSLKFKVVNEISKDSVIDALNNINVSELRQIEVSNHIELTIDPKIPNVMGGEIRRSTVSHTLEDEYNLGREFNVVSDEYGDEHLKYNSTNPNDGNFELEYKNTIDGVTHTKTYRNTETETQQIADSIRGQIKANAFKYLALLKERYLMGAKNPANVNLADLIDEDDITGKGFNTYLEEVFDFDANNPDLITTLKNGTIASYAGASIDFSELGNTYGLADLVGMGFNSTCQTCNNHYSMQFVTENSVSTRWQTVNIDGKDYKFSLEKSGQNYTLYVDLASMQANGIDDGIKFTNALVGVIDAAGYDFHFTQYATGVNDSKLYIFDNRPEYARDGTSSATSAQFSPYAYDINTIAEVDISLFDSSDAGQNMLLSYDYDYSDLFKEENLYFKYTEDADGDFVQTTDGKYVKYDPAVHAGMQRYVLEDITLKTDGKDIDAFLDEYIKGTIFDDIAKASSMSLVSDYARYKMSGEVNDNKAVITKHNILHQIMPKKYEDNSSLKIQCSSNERDFIKIPRQKLSVYRLGIKKLTVGTEESAQSAISAVDAALRKVNAIRSLFGSYQNRLEHSYANNMNVRENTQKSESVIRDTDMAEEMVKLSNNRILQQAGASMLTQANQSRSNILDMLQ